MFGKTVNLLNQAKKSSVAYLWYRDLFTPLKRILKAHSLSGAKVKLVTNINLTSDTETNHGVIGRKVIVADLNYAVIDEEKVIKIVHEQENHWTDTITDDSKMASLCASHFESPDLDRSLVKDGLSMHNLFLGAAIDMFLSANRSLHSCMNIPLEELPN